MNNIVMEGDAGKCEYSMENILQLKPKAFPSL